MKPQDQKNEPTPVAPSKTGETELTDEQLDNVPGGAVDGYMYFQDYNSKYLQSESASVKKPTGPKVA